MRQISSCVLALFLVGAPAAVQAQASDPAAAQVSRFDDALLEAMKNAKALGPQGRYRQLEPVISRTFNLPAMTRFAVGPTWSSLSPAEQTALTRAFTRNTVATYAHNFDSYSGQHFTITPQVETRGADKLVRTQLTGGSSPVTLIYRMQQEGGVWKIIDVYYNGSVSSLAGQRSEFATTLRSGGAAALVKKLDSHADQLLGR